LDEGSALGLSGPAIALVLSPSVIVSFVRAYRLHVLHGSISLLGKIIWLSRVPHRIFAPRSSPIPVIEALAAHGESLMYDIPAQITSIINEGGVIIVSQELRTALSQGLGCVMRTFEGVFSQADLEGASDMPFGGVHFVCFFILGVYFAHIGCQVSHVEIKLMWLVICLLLVQYTSF